MRLTLIAVGIALACLALHFAVLKWERRHPEDRAASERAEAERIAAAIELRRRTVAALTRVYPIGAISRWLRRGPGYEYAPMPPKRTVAIPVKMAAPKRGEPMPYETDDVPEPVTVVAVEEAPPLHVRGAWVNGELVKRYVPRLGLDPVTVENCRVVRVDERRSA